MSVTLPVNVSTRRMAAVTCTAGQTAIPYTFPLLRQEDIRVMRTRAGTTVELTLGTDFTVSGVGAPAGGTVTLTTGATAGDIIVVDGDAVLSRLTSIIQNGRFSSGQIDLELDLAVIRDQELRRDVDVLAAAPAFATFQESVEDIVGASLLAGPGLSLAYDDNTGKVTITNIGVPNGGSGNVVGPASALNAQVALFDGTSGRLLRGLEGALSSRNKLINSNFIINQRAVSGTVTLAAGAYGHDRWKAGAGGCTYTFASSGLDTIITITSGSLQQVVENVNIEGGIYALSHAGTAQARVAINGATPSGGYAAASAAAPLVTAPATGLQTVTVEFSTGTVSRAQLESGAVATAYERRHIAQEVLLCLRYYYRTAVNANNSFAINSGRHAGGSHPTANFRFFAAFPTIMRAAGTVTIYDSAGNAGRYSAFTTVWTDNNSALTLGPSITPAGFYIGHNTANTVETQFGYVVDAEL